MKNKQLLYSTLLVLGIALIIVGGVWLRDKWGAIPIGLGAGLIGLSVAQLITERIMRKNPSLQKKIKIEQSDERTVFINNMAKAKAFDFMQFLALPLFLILVLADVRLWVILLVIAFYVADWAVYLWYLNKKMGEL